MKNLNFNEMEVTQGGDGYWYCPGSLVPYVTSDNYDEVAEMINYINLYGNTFSHINVDEFIAANCTYHIGSVTAPPKEDSDPSEIFIDV